jgi:sugar lactone lactonase YvrE
MWSQDHQCFYYCDIYTPKSHTLWRVKIGEEPVGIKVEVENEKLLLTTMSETTQPNVFLGVFQDQGIAKLTIEPDSTEAKVELLGCNPIKDPSCGGGEHAPNEKINDAKTSPDGRFFFATMQ